MRPTRVVATGALAAATLVISVGAVSAGAFSDDAELVRMLDDCDRESFEQALGEGACTLDGGTTFQEAIEELREEGEIGKWKNNPRDTHIDHGESLHIVNVGGEPHTFTLVEEFGAGCVPEINELIGLHGPPAADCEQAFSQIVFPGGSTDMADLRPGEHRFQCMIHPWMTTTLEVRAD